VIAQEKKRVWDMAIGEKWVPKNRTNRGMKNNFPAFLKKGESDILPFLHRGPGGAKRDARRNGI
jgi:hypothetical protein